MGNALRDLLALGFRRVRLLRVRGARDLTRPSPLRFFRARGSVVCVARLHEPLVIRSALA
jgi:hypothetical protein